MPQKRSGKFLSHLTAPLYFLTPLNRKISGNSGRFKRIAPIGQMVEPKGKEGLISICNYIHFFRLKRRVFFGSGFLCKYPILKKEKWPDQRL
jgi:hypothetical protein